MSHLVHSIIKCGQCLDIIAQCRCMDRNKIIEYSRCDKCSNKLNPSRESSMPDLKEIAEQVVNRVLPKDGDALYIQRRATLISLFEQSLIKAIEGEKTACEKAAYDHAKKGQAHLCCGYEIIQAIRERSKEK